MSYLIPPRKKDYETRLRDSKYILLASDAHKIQDMEHLKANRIERYITQMLTRKPILLDEYQGQETLLKTGQVVL